MMLVPEGTFTMGTEGYASERPVHEVYLKAYYMDIYEVTNAEYRLCVKDGVCSLPENTDKYNDPTHIEHPVVYVDWYQASTFCEWRGARLPSEAEWEKAARGTDGRMYPWGNASRSCDIANYHSSCYHDTTPVGKFADGKSPYGMYDMAGNVWEWVSTIYQPYPYSIADGREDLNSSESRVLRGGAYSFFEGIVTTTYRNRGGPGNSGNAIGFRCTKDAMP